MYQLCYIRGMDKEHDPETCEDEECQICCEHSDVDDHCCLICGADMAERFASRAESLADMKEDR